jgi:hypothetical protein
VMTINMFKGRGIPEEASGILHWEGLERLMSRVGMEGSGSRFWRGAEVSSTASCYLSTESNPEIRLGYTL